MTTGMKIGWALVIVGTLGLVATGWLGSYLGARWLVACVVQGGVFLAAATVGLGAVLLNLEELP